MKKSFLLFTAAVSTVISSGAYAQQSVNKADVEKIVREYILEHPEVLIESIERMQKKEAGAEMEKSSKAITQNQDKIFKDATSPVAGNAAGDVTVVQFFDYNCGYCKKMQPVIDSQLAKDKNLKVVFKELPVLSQSSILAAKWALAVHMLDKSKYFGFHNEVMKHSGTINDTYLSDVVTKMGLDASKVKEKAASKDVQDVLSANQSLASALGVTGTPAFVVGKIFVPGYVQEDTFAEMVKSQRAKK